MQLSEQSYILYFTQIANPKILGLVPLPQIRKFLRYASPQIENPQTFMIISQIAKQRENFLQNTAQLCLDTGPKSRLFTGSFIMYKF
jgi:hypothetical protein